MFRIYTSVVKIRVDSTVAGVAVNVTVDAAEVGLAVVVVVLFVFKLIFKFLLKFDKYKLNNFPLIFQMEL